MALRSLEQFGNLELPTGGLHGYEGVRGKQGAKRDKFQGFTPRKTHLTKLCETAHEAAIERALLKRNLNNNHEEREEKKPRKPRCDKKSVRLELAHREHPLCREMPTVLRSIRACHRHSTSSASRCQ